VVEDWNLVKDRLLFIDILRIIGITLVVSQHVITDSGLWSSLRQFYFNISIFDIYHVYYGNIGIWLFIFASGCSLALNHRDVDTLAKAKDFYAKRLLRIYPVYWAAILFNLAVLNRVIPALSIRDYIEMFSGFQAFFASTLNDFYGKVNGAFWFVGVMVSLYLLYPILLVMIRKHPHLSLLTFLVVAVFSRVVMNQLPWVRGYDWFPLCRLFEFGLGIYLIQTGLYLKITNPNSVIAYMSNTSFHVYLVHLPLLVLIPYNVILFLVTTLVISGMLYAFDNALKQFINTQVKNILSRLMKLKRTS